MITRPCYGDLWLSEVKFDLQPVSRKPSRKYRKGSKYDPILDSFMSSEHNLVKVEVENKDANYLRTQLNKRIEARDIGGKIKVSVVNNVAYIEKL
jgi:hypothetical protein